MIRMGRSGGGLTQDDLMIVLRKVELSAELIAEVVEQIRDAGVEFTYDIGENTVVPMTGADEPGRLWPSHRRWRTGRPWVERGPQAPPVPPVTRCCVPGAPGRSRRSAAPTAHDPTATASGAPLPIRCTCI